MKMIDPDIALRETNEFCPTIEEIDALNGRDLDAFICKHILKWVYIPVSSDADGQNAGEILFYPDRNATQDVYNTLPFKGKIHEGWLCPCFHRDIEPAVSICQEVGMSSVPIEVAFRPVELSKMAIKRFFNLA